MATVAATPALPIRACWLATASRFCAVGVLYLLLVFVLSPALQTLVILSA